MLYRQLVLPLLLTVLQAIAMLYWQLQQPQLLLLVPKAIAICKKVTRRTLIIVDFPAPFSPTQATREASETCTVMSNSVGIVLPG
jgi:hypothetical protein